MADSRNTRIASAVQEISSERELDERMASDWFEVHATLTRLEKRRPELSSNDPWLTVRSSVYRAMMRSMEVL